MRRTLASVVALLALAPAAHARNPITGKLDKAGLTLIAMGRDGRVTFSTAKSDGTFTIVPPDSRVTLHLRTKAGKYGGPVIIAGTGKSLVMGVHHGVELGTVHVAAGFARVRKAPVKAKQDASFKAQGDGGRPLGAGVFGWVKATATAGATDPGADTDSDGVPNALDVDDDGDLILDAADEGALIAGSRGQVVTFSTLSTPLADSLNVDAGAGVTDAALDALLKNALVLGFPLPSGAIELNCGGLTYCDAGGTGKVFGGEAFPACCDSDHDTQGGLKPATDAANRAFLLAPGAAEKDIAAGDLLIERTKSRAWAGTTNLVFASTPAAAAWTDGTSVGPFSYPSSETAPGASGNPLTLHARASDGHVVLQLAVWRPQRRAFPGEADAFVDLGRLRYSIVVDSAPESASGGGSAAPGTGPGACSLTSYLENDASLTGTGPAVHGYLLDGTDDLTADPARTMVFSIDLTKCLGDAAITWKPGQILTAALRAADAGQGYAEQLLTLKLAATT